MALVIGLTGSIATGKSTVAQMFEQLDIPVIDADKVAREVVEPNEAALKEIESVFGADLILEDGRLDRKKLGSIVFQDDQKRKQLNNIMHPAIRKRMNEKQEELIRRGVACLVQDIPLLFENKLQSHVDKVLVVYIDEEEQLKRLMKRDQSSEEEAINRMKAQLSIEEKKRLADAYIDNRGSKEASFTQLKKILTDWDVL
ncbi:MAG TPA: dephospho-CoA kinase [Pseudogracilibacillus sp.]|nr:dephospho-CoA kinase [Pseudogracilibacillus sp.]